MKTAKLTRFTHRAAWLLGAALIFAHHSALACPGCKQNMVPGADGKMPSFSGASIGFSLGVLFMIVMVFVVVGALGMMMYRSCSAIAARQQAMMEAEDAALTDGFGPAQPQPA